MHRLRESQEVFWHLITAPEGVEQGLETLPEAQRRLPGGLEGWLRGDRRLGAKERLDIYANMYFYRLLDVLKEDYPALLAAVGEVAFHNLVTDYLLVHPSTHPSLRFLGRHLPGFLRHHPLARARPWLADLARLEWAMVEAFDGPDAEPLAAERLQALPAPRWASARLRFVPTLEVLRLSSPVHEAWSRLRSGGAAGDVGEGPTTLRVWRKGFSVFHRAVEPPEEAALGAVLAGEDLGGVCEAVAVLEPPERTPLAVAAILKGWFADGLIAGLES